jgi:regulation of enolase protein 1 (concanavalin A-like superfamily)
VDDGRRGPPYWVRLVRQGEKVIAYKSDDGQQWAETGSETLDLGETAFVGLVTTSLSGARGAAAVFDSVTVIRLP